MIELVPLTADRARRIVGGDLTGLEHAAGWPHEDTVDGLRLVESGASAWLVELDGVVIGDCGTTGPLGPEVEIGFGLAEEARGKGHGTELVRALSELLLSRHGVERIVASTDVANVASRRVLERAGFVGERESDDVVWYAR